MNDTMIAQKPRLEVPPLESLPRERLEAMRAAGEEIYECYRVLAKGGLNIVGEVLKGQGTFYEHDHYPKGDVFDADHASQYYYHAHRDTAGEHGHFHTFLRAANMPPDAAPVPYDGAEPWPRGDEALAHIVAISMDARGFPVGLFAVNRWVTAETWYPAEDVVRMIGRFRIDHAYPSWPTNRWISAMLRLFEPQIAALVRHRDAVVDAWRREHPERDVFEDRELEITGELPAPVDEQMAAIDAILR